MVLVLAIVNFFKMQIKNKFRVKRQNGVLDFSYIEREREREGETNG